MSQQTTQQTVTFELLTPEEQVLVNRISHLSGQSGNAMFYALLLTAVIALVAGSVGTIRQEYAPVLIRWGGWLMTGAFIASWEFIFRPMQRRIKVKLDTLFEEPLWASAHQKLVRINEAFRQAEPSILVADKLLNQRLLAPKILAPVVE
jgi:hypothetical protein